MTRAVFLKSKAEKNFNLILLVCLFFLLFFLSFFGLQKKNSSDIESNPQVLQASFVDYQNYAYTYGVENAYKFLKSAYKNNETSAHDYAHVIGIVAFSQKGVLGLSVCDTSYNYGCYHGFIETFIAKNGISKINLIEDACIDLGNVHAPSCLHGIGHGVMALESYNLNPALSDCLKLKNASQIYCWDGVFMERISASMQNKNEAKIINENNLNEPCDSLDQIYQKQCYRNQVSAWLNYFHQDSQKVGRQCGMLGSEYWQICSESLGNLITISSGQFDISYFTNSCQTNNNQVTNYCLVGVLAELMFEGKSPEIVYQICNYTTFDFKNNCFNRFYLLLGDYQMRFGR